jgi:hypothetical protein
VVWEQNWRGFVAGFLGVLSKPRHTNPLGAWLKRTFGGVGGVISTRERYRAKGRGGIPRAIGLGPAGSPLEAWGIGPGRAKLLAMR